MPLLLGPFHVVLLVLLISGVHKLLRPAAAAEALKASGLVTGSGRTSLSRLLGATEVSCALVAFLAPSVLSATGVAAVFSGFMWFVYRLRGIDSTAGCGCFGSSTAPPGAAHQWFNAGAAAVALTVAATVALSPALPEIELVTEQGLGAMAAYLVAASIGASLFLNGPTLLAELDAARSGDHAHRPVQTFAVSKAFKA